MKLRLPRTLRSRTCARALVLAAASTGLVHAAPINFTAAEGFTDAELNGQQGWVASAGGFSSNVVNSVAGLVSSQNGEIAVFDSAYNLALGETLDISATFQFADWNASGLVPPAMGEFWYMVRLGLKETNATTQVPSAAPAGNTRFQALDGDVKLLDGAFGGGTTGTTGAPIALGTVYTIDYTLTMGADAASTTMDVSLGDGVTTISGTITGIDAALFTDLDSGDGAFPFFQFDSPVQGGIEAAQLISIDISSAAPPVPSGSLIDFTAAEGFIDDELDGQQGWIASSGGFSSNVVNSVAGLVSSQNGEIAVYDTAYNLALGETLDITANFQFADWNASGLVPPAMGEFWYMVRLGLKETNSATLVASAAPAGNTRFQALDGDVKLLDGAFGGGTTGATGAPVALGTVYTIDYSLTMGADAASTTMDVSLGDGVTTISGTITGIDAALFTDLDSGDGAFPFFQFDTPVQGGIEAGQLISIDISSAAAPTGTTWDFTLAEGFIDAMDLNGQQGWVASTGGFISNQVVAPPGLVRSQNGEIAIYDTAYNLVVGQTLGLSASFQFTDFDESGLVPPAMGEFWYMARLGLKEDNATTLVASGSPSGSTRLQAYDGDLRLLNGAFGGGTTGTTGSPVALGTVYTIDYTLTLGSDETTTTMDVSLSDGTATISGTITGIDAALYADLLSGDGAYAFFQAETAVQGGIEAIDLLSYSIDVGTVLPPYYRKLWQDDDPLGPDSVENNGLSVTNVNSGPAIDGDHPTAGLVDHSAASKFSSIGGLNEPFSIVPGDYGQPYTLTVDYYIPGDTNMDDGDLDLIYVQMNFNSDSGGSTGANLAAGFISTANAPALDAWNTITLTGTVPATDDYTGATASGPGNAVDEVGAVFIFVDGGFGGTPDNATGTSLFVDNICLEIGAPFSGTSAPVQVNSITHNGADVVINYNTEFDAENFSGVDIYYSSDLVNWTADVYVVAVGDNLEVTRPAAPGARYYILVEPGVTPDFGSFDDPPETEWP